MGMRQWRSKESETRARRKHSMPIGNECGDWVLNWTDRGDAHYTHSSEEMSLMTTTEVTYRSRRHTVLLNFI